MRIIMRGPDCCHALKGPMRGDASFGNAMRFCLSEAKISGCHAHGFAWAWIQVAPRSACPREAVGMAPISVRGSRLSGFAGHGGEIHFGVAQVRGRLLGGDRVD